MPQISLATYTLRIRHKGQIAKYEQLGNIAGNDFLTLMLHYLNDRRQRPVYDNNAKKLLKVTKADQHSRTISGIIETGEWGYTADIENIETRSLSYKRIETDAETLPFYFLLEIPQKADEALVILEKFGNLGIRKLLVDDFKEPLSTKLPGFVVDVNPLAYQEMINQYLHGGRVTEVRLIDFTMPSDIFDRYHDGSHVEQESQVEFVWRAKKRRSLPIKERLKEVLLGQRLPSKLVELSDFPDAKQVKVRIRFKGKTRMIDLSHTDRMRTYYDVTEEVKIQNGHPTFDSIDSAARSLLGELRQQIGE